MSRLVSVLLFLVVWIYNVNRERCTESRSTKKFSDLFICQLSGRSAGTGFQRELERQNSHYSWACELEDSERYIGAERYTVTFWSTN